MYLPTFSLFYFQFCIDDHVVHPYGPVFSESTYVILIGGEERINEAEHELLFPPL